jgi:hypothetical protein
MESYNSFRALACWMTPKTAIIDLLPGEPHDLLDKKLTKAYYAIHETIKDKKVRPRHAMTLIAVTRVAEASKLRGCV